MTLMESIEGKTIIKRNKDNVYTFVTQYLSVFPDFYTLNRHYV